MTALTEAFRARLPETMTLPPEFADLFEWIEANGFASDWEGTPVGSLNDPDGWGPGTVVMFTIETPEEQDEHVRLWTGNTGLPRVLVPFARTGQDGSYAAFWLDEKTGRQRIVHLGSGSGSILTCVLAEEPIDFLRLLAIGYDEVCWLDAESYDKPPALEDPEDEHEPVNQPYRDWLTARGVSIPETAADIVRHPEEMDSPAGEDDFHRWVETVTGY